MWQKIKEREYNMEISKENIDELVDVLKIGKFNDSLLLIQKYSEIAKNIIEENKTITVDELGQKYDEKLSLQDKIKEYE